MVSRPFVSGWALIVIGCCGNAPGWANIFCLVAGVLIVWYGDDGEDQS